MKIQGELSNLIYGASVTLAPRADKDRQADHQTDTHTYTHTSKQINYRTIFLKNIDVKLL